MTADVVPIERGREIRLELDNSALDQLPGLVDGVEVRFPPAMPEHVQRLMATLGARVVFDTAVPVPTTWRVA